MFLQVPVDADDAEIEERILQHLAAAAAIRRSHRHARREGRRSRSAAHGHPQILFFPSAEATPAGGSLSSNSQQEGDHEHASAATSSQALPTVDPREETAADTSVNDTTSANGSVESNDRYFLQNRGLHCYGPYTSICLSYMGLTLVT